MSRTLPAVAPRRLAVDRPRSVVIRTHPSILGQVRYRVADEPLDSRDQSADRKWASYWRIFHLERDAERVLPPIAPVPGDFHLTRVRASPDAVPLDSDFGINQGLAERRQLLFCSKTTKCADKETRT